MKNLRKVLGIIIVLALVLTPVTAEIGKVTVQEGQQAIEASVSVNSADAATSTHLGVTKKTMYVGGSAYTLKLYTASGSRISASKVVWKSSNKSVATISSSGKITPKAKGTARITAEYNGKVYSMSLTVLKKVTVSTTAGLVKNLGNYTVLSLKPGVYNLTDYLDTLTYSETPEGIDSADYYSDAYYVRKGVYAEPVFDGGYQLILSEMKSLTIKSVDPDNPAEIVVSPRYANVMAFDRCKNISLKDLVMGHTPDMGYCAGAVLYFDYGSNIKITDCDLYGCGTYGVEAYYPSKMTIDGCYIHDCSYGGVTIGGGVGSVIKNSIFERTGDFAAISAGDGAFIDVLFCSIKRVAEPFSAGRDCWINAENCVFDDDAWAKIPAQGPNENIQVSVG